VLAANRSAFYRGAQTVKKRHLRLFKFSARNGFGEKPGLINLRKTLEPPRAGWPFHFEQIRFELERFWQIAFERPGVHSFATLLYN
jgi:hypothetical protein